MKSILRVLAIVLLGLFVFLFLFSVFVYPGQGSLISLTNPLFIGALIGLIFLLGINKKIW